MENSENKYNIDMNILQSLIEKGPDFLNELFRIAMNEAMKMERDYHLNAGAYERSAGRNGYANGFKPKTLNMRNGAVTLAIPQVRNCDFYPSSLQQGIRSERAFKTTMAEMYVQGVSTRKVKNILEKMCGLSVSSTQVSEAAKMLDEDLRAFKERPLGCYSVLYVDAQYQKVRINGCVTETAVLQAIGVNEQGCREVIGVSASTSEAEVHWRTFFSNLVSRGLHGVQLIISDNHAGMKAARRAVFPSVSWQRCYFHLCQNTQAFARRMDEKDEIARSMCSIFSYHSKDESQMALRGAVEFWLKERKHPRFAQWLDENAEESMTYFEFDESCWRKIRTSNCIERLNREIKRRTKTIGIFPNIEACERLIGSLLLEKHEEWIDEKSYLTIKK